MVGGQFGQEGGRVERISMLLYVCLQIHKFAHFDAC